MDEEGLAALLALRPDLAVPAPASLEELEARAFSVPSVLRALLDADASVLQLVQIFTILGEKHARLADVRKVTGDGTESAVTQALAWLARRHLVVPVSGDEFCVHPAFLSVVGAAALGPPAAELVERLTVSDLQSVLSAIGRRAGAGRKAVLVGHVLDFLADGDAVRDLVAGAPAEARALALQLANSSAPLPLPWDMASGVYRREQGRGAGSAPTWLLQHGLAYRDTWVTALMPREVGLALRGGRPFSADSYRRPRLDIAPLADPSLSAVEARVLAVTQAVERMVESLGSRPCPVLKSGGIGVREVRRLAADIEMTERDAFRLVEVAAGAGLVVDDTRRALVLPTPAADHWLELDLADRWWVLARSWSEMAVHASLAGAIDTRRKVVPALAYIPDTPTTASAQRRGVLKLVVELRHGAADADTSLAQVATWDAPLAWSDVVAPAPLITGWVLSEMELLGLALDGAPTSLARALVEDDAEGARRVLANAAADVWEMVLQADLTALVTGRVPSRLRVELTLLADVEGRGSATVYRFSEGSVRRAFDAGRTGEEILDFLETHAAKGVPQALAYLVGDVERRHGHMRLGQATCYVRFDDAALATEVLRAKKTVKLGLRQIAPTVLVSDSPQLTVLSALRGCGYLPVAETEDGTLVRTAVARERAQPGRSPGLSRAAGHDHGAEDQAARWGLRARDDDTATGAGTDRMRALATKLLGSAGDGPHEHARARTEHPRPGMTHRVEIPTVLRRPRDAPDPMGGSATLVSVPTAPPSRHDPGGLFDTIGLGARYDGDFDEDFDDDDFEDFDDEDVDGVRHGEQTERPSEIFRSRDAVLHVLQLADEEEWLARISYTSGAGKTFEVTVDILDVSDQAMLALAAPRWTEQKYVLERIEWARVLTEAEEELTK